MSFPLTAHAFALVINPLCRYLTDVLELPLPAGEFPVAAFNGEGGGVVRDGGEVV